MSAQVAADLRAAAEVLANEGWRVAYDAICEARDAAPRRSDDRDSAAVLLEVIAALRAAADRAEAEQ